MHHHGISEKLSNFQGLITFIGSSLETGGGGLRRECYTKRFHEIIYLKIVFPRVVSSSTTIKDIFNVCETFQLFCKVILQMTCNIFPSYDVFS